MKQEMHDIQYYQYWYYKILRIIGFSSIFFYLVIAMLLPNIPNNDFYMLLNQFFDDYLFGHYLPTFSDQFSFKAKVLWCSSLILSVIISTIIFRITLYKIGANGIAAIQKKDEIEFLNSLKAKHSQKKTKKFDNWIIKNNYFRFLFTVIFYFLISVAAIFTNISTYVSNPNDEVMTVIKGITHIFYGKFYAFLAYFILSQLITYFVGQKILFKLYLLMDNK